MGELKEFDINIDGVIHKAIVVWTYEYNGKVYCIYAVKDENKNYNIYNGEIVNNVVVPISEEDKDITDKISESLTGLVRN